METKVGRFWRSTKPYSFPCSAWERSPRRSARQSAWDAERPARHSAAEPRNEMEKYGEVSNLRGTRGPHHPETGAGVKRFSTPGRYMRSRSLRSTDALSGPAASFALRRTKCEDLTFLLPQTCKNRRRLELRSRHWFVNPTERSYTRRIESHSPTSGPPLP
jgi:hypothetical protein